MKVYIAAKYARRFELRHFAQALQSHGIEVTSRWLDNEDAEGDGPANAAQIDLADVNAADALVFFGEPQGSLNVGGGRWFEFGYGYAAGKRCIAVLSTLVMDEITDRGDGRWHESVFTHLPNVEIIYSPEQAMRALL